MNTISWFVDGSFSTRLTLSLMHFFWQGCFAGMVVFIGGLLLSNASARIRYSLNVAVMLAMAVCLPTTFFLIDVHSSRVDGPKVSQSSHAFDDSRIPYAAVEQPVDIDTEQVADSTTRESRPIESAGAIAGPQKEAPINAGTVTSSKWHDAIVFSSLKIFPTLSRWVTGLYLCGVAMVLGRLLQGVWGGRQLRMISTVITEAVLLDSVRKLARQLGLKSAPAVAWCEQISIPVVVGVVRPMILLPTAIVSGLTPDQLQALLLHELSHIRRLDPIVNLLQRIIEAILFFHPVVWFVSRRISTERENAADDMVLAAGWDRPLYADALVRVAELASALSKPDTALPATLLGSVGTRPSEFKLRILRLLGSRPPKLDVSRAGITLALALAALIVGGGTMLAWSQSGKSDRSSDNGSSIEESMETKSEVDAPSNTPDTPTASASLRIKYDMPGAEAETRIFVERIDPEFQSKHGRRDEYGSDEYGGVRFSRLKNGDSLTLSDLPAGKYRVARYRLVDIVREGAGKAQSSVYLDGQWSELADQETNSISLSRPAGQPISGRVVIPADLKVNTLVVHVCSENARSSGSLNHRDVTHFDALNADADGKFKSEPLPPGRYKVFIEAYADHSLVVSGIIAPSWGGTSEVTVTESVEPAALDVTLSQFDREAWLKDQTEAASSHSAPDVHSRSTGILPDGQELEVVGVAHANIVTPSGTQRKTNDWWKADGTPFYNEPFTKLQPLSVSPSLAASESKHFREFVLQLKTRPIELASPENARMRKWNGELWFGAQHEQRSAMTWDADNNLLHQAVIGFAKEDPSVMAFYYTNAPTIDVGTIGIDGKVEASVNASDPIKDWLQDVKVADIEKSATETAVKLNRSYSQITSTQVFVIAIAVDGTIVTPNTPKTTDRFVFKLPFSEIDVFQIKVRPMTHRVDCEDLALLPNQKCAPRVTVTPLDELATVTFRKNGKPLGTLDEIRLKDLPGILKLLQPDLNSEEGELVIETHRAVTREDVERIVATLKADGWKWPKITLTPLKMNTAVKSGEMEPQPDGLKFLKQYPKLHGLSLEMTEPQFLDIFKQQELKVRKTVDGENVTHHIDLGDGHTLMVMFDKDGKCGGIQRVRGEDEDKPAVVGTLVQVDQPQVVDDYSKVDDPDVLLDELAKSQLPSLLPMTGGGFFQQPGTPPQALYVSIWESQFARDEMLDPRIRRLIELGDRAVPRVHQRLNNSAASDIMATHLTLVLGSVGGTESVPVLIRLLKTSPNTPLDGTQSLTDEMKRYQASVTQLAVTSALWKLTGRKHVFTPDQWEQWWQSVKPDFVVPRDRQRPEFVLSVTPERVNALANDLANNEVAARERLIALGPASLPHLLTLLMAELPKPPLNEAALDAANLSQQSKRLAWVIDELDSTDRLPAKLRREYFAQRFADAGTDAGLHPIDEAALCRALSHCSFADYCSIYLEADSQDIAQQHLKWPQNIYGAYCRRFNKMSPPNLGGWSDDPHWNNVVPTENPSGEITDAVPVLLAALKDERGEMRLAASKLAAAIGFCCSAKPETLIVALRDAWLTETDEKVRPEIAFAMCRFQTPFVVEEVAKGLLSNRPEIVSDCAGLIDWLPIQLNDETRASFELLVELTRHENDKLRNRAVRSLRGKAVKLLEPELLRLSQDKVIDIRKECAYALRDKADPKFADILFQLANDSDEQVRIEAINSIANLKYPESMPRLVPLLRDKQVYGYAVSALASIGGKDALPLMMSELESSNDVGGMVYQHLRRLTGEEFEEKPEPWLAWWKQNKPAPKPNKDSAEISPSTVPDAKTIQAKELASFQGTWCWDFSQPWTWPRPIGVGTDSDGRKSERRWMIEGNRITWVGQDGQRFYADFTIDPFKTPKQIEFTFLNGPNRGQKSVGIYESKGDEDHRDLCMTDPGSDAPRPTDFSAGDSLKQSIIVIYRVTPPAKPSAANELKRLQGVWNMTLCDSTHRTFGGTQQEASTWKWTIKDDELLWSRQGEVWKLKLNINPPKSPREMDLTFVSAPFEMDLTFLDGPFQGAKCQGIFGWGGVDLQSLMIAIQDPGSDASRPTKFAMNSAVKTGLWMLRPSKPSDVERELTALQGTWTLRNFDTGNVERNKDPSTWPLPGGKGPDRSGEGSDLLWTIKGNDISWTSSTGQEIKASFTIDSHQHPKQIDLAFLSGPDKGKTCPGIYQRGDLDENILWLCMADPDSKAARPKEFSYRWGEGRSVLSLYPQEPQ